MMESVDEVTFTLDGLRPAAQKRTRRASLLALLGICASAERHRVLRSQGCGGSDVDDAGGFGFITRIGEAPALEGAQVSAEFYDSVKLKLKDRYIENKQYISKVSEFI
ncbi:hypothetical protein ACJX0J_028091, partial [Zea mays]